MRVLRSGPREAGSEDQLGVSHFTRMHLGPRLRFNRRRGEPAHAIRGRTSLRAPQFLTTFEIALLVMA